MRDDVDGVLGGTLSLAKVKIGAANKTVDLNAPSGLAAGYALTWPSALPGRTRYLAVDASGNIIAGRQNVPLMVPGGLFVPNGSTTGLTRNGSVWTITATSSTLELIADLFSSSLIPGVTLSSLKWSGTVGGNGLQVRLRLRKRSFGDNGATSGDAVNDVTNWSSAQTVVRETIQGAQAPYDIEDNIMYQLSISFTGGTATLDGVRLLIDRI